VGAVGYVNIYPDSGWWQTQGLQVANYLGENAVVANGSAWRFPFWGGNKLLY